MIDLTKAKVGDVVWVEKDGTVAKGVISYIRNYSSYSSADVKIGNRIGYGTGANWYPTRKEAVAVAQVWVDSKRKATWARLKRLEKKAFDLKREASRWYMAGTKGTKWNRYGFDMDVLATVWTNGKWLVKGVTLGEAPTLNEAAAAADAALESESWTVDKTSPPWTEFD